MPHGKREITFGQLLAECGILHTMAHIRRRECTPSWRRLYSVEREYEIVATRSHYFSRLLLVIAQFGSFSLYEKLKQVLISICKGKCLFYTCLINAESLVYFLNCNTVL